jgi:hypothetical protein
MLVNWKGKSREYKIILINYAKKTKLIHAWAGGKAQNG